MVQVAQQDSLRALPGLGGGLFSSSWDQAVIRYSSGVLRPIGPAPPWPLVGWADLQKEAKSRCIAASRHVCSAGLTRADAVSASSWGWGELAPSGGGRCREIPFNPNNNNGLYTSCRLERQTFDDNILSELCLSVWWEAIDVGKLSQGKL